MTLVLLAAIGAMSMSVFLPSLPAMAAHFDTSYDMMQLSVSLYLLVTGLLQLFIGPLADRFGRRKVMLWALVGFLAATLGCLFAPTIEIFLACRMAQAVVATGLVLSRAVVRDMYPTNEAASMIGYVTMGMAVVPMIAPMIGGALDLAFGWQATFAFLALSGAAVTWLAFLDMGETNPSGQSSFAQQMRDTPELLRSPRFWGYVLAAAFASGSFFAFLGGAPLVASDIFGLSAFWAGVGFGAPAMGYFIGNYLTGRFAGRVGVNRMILIGTCLTVSGIGFGIILNIAGMTGPYVFFLACTSIGLGNGFVVPNAAAGSLSVRPKLAGSASGVGSAAMIGGGSLLSMLASVVLGWGDTALPLLALMITSSTLGLISILFVIWRDRVLKRPTD